MKLFTKNNTDLALLLIRLGLASVFIVSGWNKINNMEGTAAFFATLGLGMFWAYVVAWVELLGGLAMLVGLFSRLAGVALAVDMVMAIYLATWVKGFANSRLEFMLLLAGLTIFFAGPGRYAIMKKW